MNWNNLNNVLVSFLDVVKRREAKGILEVQQREREHVACNHIVYVALSHYIDGYTIKEGDKEITFCLSLINDRYVQLARIGQNVLAIDISVEKV